MFPSGRPGAALLLVRIAVAVMLVDGLAYSFVQLGSAWFLLAPATVAIALCIGVVTPIASVLCVVLELVPWTTATGSIEAAHVCAVLTAIALFMLGPGAYSLDARLFGRRRVVL